MTAAALLCLKGHLVGRGVPQDFVEPFMWMYLATCQAADREAKKRYLRGRTAVAKWLTRTQMCRARKLAHLWTVALQQPRSRNGPSGSDETSESLTS